MEIPCQRLYTTKYDPAIHMNGTPSEYRHHLVNHMKRWPKFLCLLSDLISDKERVSGTMPLLAQHIQV